ncbi:MAG: hypothetical protein CMJ81_03160 [Planctomycetaceae bacterium]|nr:hypothetical protein [Planctomycetaceae bacterium]MBP60174.1 hypothetical protein [Planctomycetaceae bacterium]
MFVLVELFGIPRQRAGQAVVKLEVCEESTCLGNIVLQLTKLFPDLAEECFEGRRLQTGYIASIGGKTFVRSPDTKIRAGESLLVMSADSGG